ncbi:lactate racemase domain-containing protein [Tuwongella immobilis]|uniref:LarA-like N-terminal domain-containing protein n=1 Tax=Tuwongella immobilis TaxID=692036 RepID=A0A6C2YWF7_9BACT|nr:lactate racemase domain-containing protein [Tuwongella immobilis]VIP05269.1 Uncharacterized protein OS=Phytophthora ramorum PE=4 SV=1: DUF2088 [Tuwongella immobilis]VTS07894.1 Uncharacterized protein OS=Phytophthora ramorum PE=4 SV=1: DUF2088 [Tuwongella immobilis]
MNFFAEGGVDTIITPERAGELVDSLLEQLESRRPLKRVLLIPPDITRYYSWAGPLTVMLYQRLVGRAEVQILPALGTHVPMTPPEMDRMFPGIPHERFLPHDWRNAVVDLGEVPASVVEQLSEGKLHFSAKAQVNRLLLDPSWDAIISIGQLVPHEVIGIANHIKNILVGVGGSDLINKSHWLGAVYGMERIMGQAVTPVRSMLNYAAEHYLAQVPLVYLLTVRARAANGQLVTRGLYAGDDTECFLTGAELCRAVNLDPLPRAPKKVVVYLEAEEYRSTWLGNKSVYRTRMAVDDDGELIVLAPGVKEFGEDPTIDRLIRQFGYRGTPTTLANVEQHPELARNLSAAAHLIHGSSEGRFRITYCPGKLSREEIEGVGFGFGDLNTMLARYNPETLKDGWNDVNGEEVFFVSNPGLGLWGTRERFGLAPLAE